jgi:hypothetical protein
MPDPILLGKEANEDATQSTEQEIPVNSPG